MAHTVWCADCGVVAVRYEGEYCDKCIEETVRYLEQAQSKEEDIAYSAQLYLFRSGN